MCKQLVNSRASRAVLLVVMLAALAGCARAEDATGLQLPAQPAGRIPGTTRRPAPSTTAPITTLVNDLQAQLDAAAASTTPTNGESTLPPTTGVLPGDGGVVSTPPVPATVTPVSPAECGLYAQLILFATSVQGLDDPDPGVIAIQVGATVQASKSSLDQILLKAPPEVSVDATTVIAWLRAKGAGVPTSNDAAVATALDNVRSWHIRTCPK